MLNNKKQEGIVLNTLNLRIINTHDVEVNWNLCVNFVPRAGEIIVYDVDETHTYERFKIGDGVRTVVDLPFALDSTLESIFDIEHNVIYADAGRITDYEDKQTS